MQYSGHFEDSGHQQGIRPSVEGPLASTGQSCLRDRSHEHSSACCLVFQESKNFVTSISQKKSTSLVPETQERYEHKQHVQSDLTSLGTVGSRQKGTRFWCGVKSLFQRHFNHLIFVHCSLEHM